jgi:hypothetical protein
MCLWHDDHPKQLEDYREDLGDGRSGEDRVEPDEDDFIAFQPPDIPVEETAAWLKDRGLQLRQELLDLVCPEEDFE